MSALGKEIYKSIFTAKTDEEKFLAMQVYADWLEEHDHDPLTAECWRLLGSYRRRAFAGMPTLDHDISHGWYVWGAVSKRKQCESARRAELPKRLWRALPWQEVNFQHPHVLGFKTEILAYDAIVIAYHVISPRSRLTVRKQMEKWK